VLNPAPMLDPCYARRFYAPILVSPHLENGIVSAYVISDKTKQEQAELNLRMMHFDGTVVNELQQVVSLPPLSSIVVAKLPVADLNEAGSKLDPSKVFVSAELSIDGHIVSSNVIYLVPTKQVKLPLPQIQSQLSKSGDGYDLVLNSPVLAKSVLVAFGNLDTETSDNYLDLLPHEPLQIHVKTSASEEQVKSQMTFSSLADSFGPPMDEEEKNRKNEIPNFSVLLV
jgi:beta-mannosidase